MKKTLFLLLTALAFVLQNTIAQNVDKVTYSYDASGNRMGRTIIFEETNTQIKSAVISDTTQTVENATIEQKAKEEYSDVFGEQKISVFPVPTEGLLNILLTGFDDTAVRFCKITDMNGKLIRQTNFASNQTTMDISDVRHGVYFLILKAGDKSTTWKIIKK